MKLIVLVCGACALGCGLPKVTLGASVSLGTVREVDAAERRTVRSALWLAMSYAPRDRQDAPPPASTDRVWLEHDAAPCAIDVACAWEREAAYEASWGRAPIAPLLDEEGEAWP